MEGITGILIYTGLGAGIFFALYALVRWFSGKSAIFDVATGTIKTLDAVLRLFDKHPEDENVLERAVRIANYVVPAMKQAYEKLEATDPAQAHQKMKDEALNLVTTILEQEGIQIDDQTRWIADRAIEAIVFFLPKPDSVGATGNSAGPAGAVRNLPLEEGPDGVVRPFQP